MNKLLILLLLLIPGYLMAQRDSYSGSVYRSQVKDSTLNVGNTAGGYAYIYWNNDPASPIQGSWKVWNGVEEVVWQPGVGVNIYNTNGTLTDNRTLSGDAKSLSLLNMSSFTATTTGNIVLTSSAAAINLTSTALNVNSGSINLSGTSGINLIDNSGVFITSTFQTQITGGGNTFVMVRHNLNRLDLGGGTGGITLTSVGAGADITLTTPDDVIITPSDDINLNPTDDLLLNGTSGTTGQLIGNTSGHAEWVNQSTLTGVSNIYNNNGTLVSNRTVNGGGFTFTISNTSQMDLATTGAMNLTGNGGIQFTTAGGTNIVFNAFGSGADMVVTASDDINMLPGDDLLIDNVAGTTGQFIGNAAGHPIWATPANIYNIDGSLTGNRNLSGSGFSLNFSSISTFGIATSTGGFLFTSTSGSVNFTTTTGSQTFDSGNDLNLHATNQLSFDSDNDMSWSIADKLFINGVQATTNQIIGNINGTPTWVDPPPGGGGGTPTSAVLEVETTTVGNVTTGEDVLWTYTIPADTLTVDGQFIRGHISGQVANNTNPKTFKLKYGATTFLTKGTFDPVIGQGYVIDWELIRTGPTTQKLNATFKGSDGIVNAYYATGSATLSGTVVIQLTGEATATNDIQKHTSITTWGFGGDGTGGGGGGTGVSISDFVTREIPSGAINGSNVNFTSAFTPVAGFHLYHNGLLQEEGPGEDYTRSGSNIVFTFAPSTGDKLTISYIK